MTRRPGYTIIEVALVLVLIAIMAAMAIPRISLLRYRQDANGRLVQHSLLVAQQRSLRHNTNVLFVVDYAQSRMRIVEDTNSNGAVDGGEPWDSQKLAEGSTFAMPTTTVDGAAPYYATGAGITTTASGPTITFYPNGSASGDAYLYIGVPTGRSDALRAIQFEGSTGRSHLWRYLNGAWRRDSI